MNIRLAFVPFALVTTLSLAAFAPATLGAVLTIDNAANTQNYPAVAAQPRCIGDRQFLVAYQDRVNGTDNDIWGRYVLFTGLGLGSPAFQMTSDKAEQQSPAVTPNVDTFVTPGYIVAWADQRNGNWDIFVRMWDCFQQPISPEFQVTFDQTDKRAPDVVCGYDICWVVWEDLRDGNWNIYGQRLNPNASPLGGNMLLSGAADTQSAVAIAYNPTGNGCSAFSFLAVWQDRRTPANGFDLYSQQLDNLGPCGGNVATYTGPRDQTEPDIAHSAIDARYLVSWQDARPGSLDIMGMRVRPDGASDAAAVALTVDPASQTRPAVAWDDATNQFLTVWADQRTGVSDIYGQRTTPFAAPIGGNFLIQGGTAKELNPAVAFCTTADHYFVPWNTSSDVLGRAYWP